MELYDAQGARLAAASELSYLHGGYGEGLAVGMQIEEDEQLYTVTDLADGKAVLDANHPLAGMALRFSLVILTVRDATEEEVRRGVSLPQG